MDRDISNLSRPELVQKYKNMKELIIRTSLAESISDEAIKSNSITEKGSTPLNFTVDLDNEIIIKANEYNDYRNAKNQILMIITDNFEVLN